jgi:hypothetical protein
MVRRGSTVRVRQRALGRGKSPEIGDFCCLAQHHRAPPHYRREGYSARCAAAKTLQIDLLPGYLGTPPEEGGDRQSSTRRDPPRTAWTSVMWRGLARRASRASLGIGFGDAPLAAARLWSVSPVNGLPEGSAFPLATASRGVSRVAHVWRSPACLQAPRIESRLAEPRLSCASWAAFRSDQWWQPLTPGASGP